MLTMALGEDGHYPFPWTPIEPIFDSIDDGPGMMRNFVYRELKNINGLL